MYIRNTKGNSWLGNTEDREISGRWSGLSGGPLIGREVAFAVWCDSLEMMTIYVCCVYVWCVCMYVCASLPLSRL